MAPQERVEANEIKARIVLKAIAEVAECENMFYAWISDESHIGDFFTQSRYSEEEYKKACHRVGELLRLDLSDVEREKGYIVNIAERMKTEELDPTWVTSGGMLQQQRLNPNKVKGQSEDANGDS